MAGTPQRRNDDRLIVFTIPFRGRASTSARASPPALTKTQQTKPKRETPPRSGGVSRQRRQIGRRPTAIVGVSDRSLSAGGTDPRT